MSATAPETQDVNGPQPDLKRVMGPKLLLLFIVGDILGAGVYAVTGSMAAIVGGVVWLPFLVAFIVATLTALSYLELVTKYPQAAGAALYAHKAFGVHFITFLVAFAVICSGITSASTSSNVLALNLFGGLEVNGWIDGMPSTGVTTAVAMGFMVLLALINLRGVGESVKFNVVLTLVEVTALAIVIGVGFYAIASGGRRPQPDHGLRVARRGRGCSSPSRRRRRSRSSRWSASRTPSTWSRRSRSPSGSSPAPCSPGSGIAVILYMLVAVSVVAVLTSDEIFTLVEEESPALIAVVSQGAPDFPIDLVFPFLACFAVANTALINMLMASRLLYGLANQDVLPRSLGKVSPNTPHAVRRHRLLDAAGARTDLLRRQPARERHRAQPGQHHRAAAARGVHRRQHRLPGDCGATASAASSARPGSRRRSRPSCCLYLVGPWVDRPLLIYQIAGGLLAIGVVLWAITWLTNRGVRAKKTGFRDIEHMEDDTR